MIKQKEIEEIVSIIGKNNIKGVILGVVEDNGNYGTGTYGLLSQLEKIGTAAELLSIIQQNSCYEGECQCQKG